jgi:hypothetical protein
LLDQLQALTQRAELAPAQGGDVLLEPDLALGGFLQAQGDAQRGALA